MKESRFEMLKTRERKENKWHKYLCMISKLPLKLPPKLSFKTVWDNAAAFEKKKKKSLLFNDYILHSIYFDI